MSDAYARLIIPLGIVDYITELEQRKLDIIKAYNGKEITDEELWHLLSGPRPGIPVKVAGEIYRELGYQPFAGYPLQKIQKEKDDANN